MEDTYNGVRDNDATPGRTDANEVVTHRHSSFSSLNTKIRRLKFSRGGRKRYNRRISLSRRSDRDICSSSKQMYARVAFNSAA